jgi:CPA2 family monovalent cation:H+ antiporter-2
MIAAEALVQFGIPVEHAMAKVRSIRASRYATLKEFYKNSEKTKFERNSE